LPRSALFFHNTGQDNIAGVAYLVKYGLQRGFGIARAERLDDASMSLSLRLA
jgi:hypothetical protein